MSCFSWNIRGFNKLRKHSVVKDLVRSHSMDFGALLETRVAENKAAQISTSVFRDWSMAANYEHNSLGRIWVLWSNRVNLVVVFKSAQMMSCLIKLPESSEDFLCSFIYASNDLAERYDLWRDLKAHQDSSQFRGKAWMCVGDFNEVLNSVDHSLSSVAHVSLPGMRMFQETTQYCSLMDMASHGPHFTWCNKRDVGLVCKKLDRVLINSHWLEHSTHSSCVFEAKGCSDHLCGIIRLNPLYKPKAPFKIVNAILEKVEFHELLESYWNRTQPIFSSTSALFRLSKKLKMLKPAIRHFSRNALHHLSRRTAEAYKLLCEKQQQTLSHPDTISIQNENTAFDDWERISTLEEKYLRQRSKLHWLKVGDKNNKFFHNAIKEREVYNSIHMVHSPSGVLLTHQDDIKTEATRYFTDLFSLNSQGHLGASPEDLSEILTFSCTDEDRARVMAEVTDEEIKKVLFAMPSNKAPGPDGYSVEFFKAAWTIVGNDFIAAIKSFFRFGFLPKGLNTTILALIPKKTGIIGMKDYRPISCCNVIYKVISKLLASRLKLILPSFITHNQSAFIKDRYMMENMLLASDLVNKYHNENVSPRCAMKIDISKAFDSVQWSFLLNILHAINLPPRFIRWVELCVTTPSFSVQLNGELTGFFRSERGLRQGCSLSPYLFVICMNCLSRMLDNAARDGRFGFHPGCKSLGLTHLCFADDIMVFTDGRVSSIQGILTVFDHFASISGLTISLQKTSLFIAGVSPAIRTSLATFPFNIGVLPVRYLGLPLLTKRMTTSDYQPLLEKIRTRIGSWKNRFLSFAGRLQLLSSVIASLTNFWISAFRLPRACIREIEQISSSFLWSGTDLNPNKAKVAWEDVCKPKNEGGLGLRSLELSNKVSCLKLIWRLVTSKTSLWVRWIHKHLIRTATFWSVKSTTQAGSWMWRKLLKYRDVAKGFHKVQVHNGTHTSFWHDHWSSFGRLVDILGNRGCIDMGIKSTETLGEVFDNHRRRRHRTAMHSQLEEEIHTLRDNRTSVQDVSLWRGKGNKFMPHFSSKDTWSHLRVHSPDLAWAKGVWFPHSTPKFSFITWLAILNRLSTGDRMVLWNSNTPSGCVLCSNSMETRDHLFFSCSFASQVWWRLMARILQHRYTDCFHDILLMVLSSGGKETRDFIAKYVFQVAVYFLWRERNKRRHGDNPSTIDYLIRDIGSTVRNRLSTLQSQGIMKLGLQEWFATRL